jgi:flagellar hook-basal body complex protein FliE
MSVPAIEPGGFTPYVPPTLEPTTATATTGAETTGAVAGTAGVSGAAGATGAAGAAGSSGADFASILSGGLDRLQAVHDRADSLAVQAATGNLSNLHDYTIAATEAQVTTQLTAAVRNKALEAFTEIMRMSI